MKNPLLAIEAATEYTQVNKGVFYAQNFLDEFKCSFGIWTDEETYLTILKENPERVRAKVCELLGITSSLNSSLNFQPKSFAYSVWVLDYPKEKMEKHIFELRLAGIAKTIAPTINTEIKFAEQLGIPKERVVELLNQTWF